MCLKTWFYLLYYTISVTTLLLISCSKRWEAVYDQLNEVEIISLICAGTKIPSLSFRGFPSLKWQRVRLQSTSSCGADWSPHTSCSAGADSSAGKICTYTWLCPVMLCYVMLFFLLLNRLFISIEVSGAGHLPDCQNWARHTAQRHQSTACPHHPGGKPNSQWSLSVVMAYTWCLKITYAFTNQCVNAS